MSPPKSPSAHSHVSIAMFDGKPLEHPDAAGDWTALSHQLCSPIKPQSGWEPTVGDSQGLLSPAAPGNARSPQPWQSLKAGLTSHPIYKIHSCTVSLKRSSYELVLLKDIYTNSMHVRFREDLSKEILPEEVLGSHIICFI